MKTIFAKTPYFLRAKNVFCKVLLLFSVLFCLLLFSACKNKVDYFSYASEIRSNIFYAEANDYTLRIYAVEKEYPYQSDGIKMETSMRTEIRLLAPSGDKAYELFFTVNGKEYGGELSYDNVRAEYYYSCTLDVSSVNAIDCRLLCGETEISFCAKSIKTENTLSARQIIDLLCESERELFATLTDKYGFAGEIYIRLLYEDFPYYYVGVIDRSGNTTAFLINGETGKILARRQS